MLIRVSSARAKAGPVTAVSIPTKPLLEPSSPCSSSISNATYSQDGLFHGEVIGNVCMVAKGPWVEIFPRSYIRKQDTREEHTTNTSQTSLSNDYNSIKLKYRHRTFGSEDDNESQSGSIHGIRHSYTRIQHSEGNNNNFKNNYDTHVNTIPTPTIFSFFGGTKLSFAYAKTQEMMAKETSRNIQSNNNDWVDPFISIPIIQQSTHRRNRNISSYLTVSDLIYDVRLLLLDNHYSSAVDGASVQQCSTSSSPSYDNIRMLAALGLAHNIVEIWSFHSITTPLSSSTQDNSMVNYPQISFHPTRLRKIVCNVRCITYSLSLFGWKHAVTTDLGKSNNNDVNLTSTFRSNDNKDVDEEDTNAQYNSAQDLELAVAVGTVSNQILVWNVIDMCSGKDILDAEEEVYRSLLLLPASTMSPHTIPNHESSDIIDNNDCGATNDHYETNKSQHPVHVERKEVVHTLSGHEGVIFSCKFGFGGKYIASTSDDRTVRLWKWRCDSNDSDTSTTGTIHQPHDKDQILSENETFYQAHFLSNKDVGGSFHLVWSGFAHTARVWDCDFILLSSSICSIMYPNIPINDDAGDTIMNSGCIVSSGEDGTVRMWSMKDGEELAILKGHVCQNIWKVCCGRSLVCSNDRRQHECSDGPLIVSGGNDGVAKVWDACYHLFNNLARNDEDADAKSDDPSQWQVLEVPKYSVISHNNDTVTKDSSFPPIQDQEQRAVDDGLKKKQETNNDDVQLLTQKKKKKKKKSNKASPVKGLCGMMFYHNGNKILCCTRTGWLLSLCLQTHCWTKLRSWSNTIKNTSLSNLEINPERGCCLAIHDTEAVVAIGTTKGEIILCSILEQNELLPQNVHGDGLLVIPPSEYLAIQGVRWIDSQNLIVFHIKGIVVWWRFAQSLDHTKSLSSLNQPRRRCVLNMKTEGITVGVPVSHLYTCKSKEIMYVGDTRGNVAAFDLSSAVDDALSNESTVELFPADLLTRVHKKEHVNCIISTDDDSGFISCGNDGYIHECSVIFNPTLKMRKGLTLPVSDLSGIRHLYRAPQNGNSKGSIIASGYHGNDFVLWDVTFGYQLLSVDSGGRQRRMELDVNFSRDGSFSYPIRHTLAVLHAKNDGSNEISVHSSIDRPQYGGENSVLGYSLGNPCHGETINDAKICRTKIPGSYLVLSGSNDCTVKLSLVKDKSITLINELPPHESCVRALAVSQHYGSSSSLIVVCGGKLEMSFYQLDEEITSNDGKFSVHFLCQSKLSMNSSMDHRINAVKAVPLHKSEHPKSHLVLSGDSDGGVHITIVEEDIGQRRSISSYTLMTDSRPILCIDMLRIGKEHIIACLGDTGGSVSFWILPGCIDKYESNEEFVNSFPSEPAFVYKAQDMGTNCACLKVVKEKNTNAGEIEDVTILVASGGDDQSINTSLLEFNFKNSSTSSSNAAVQINHLVSIQMKESSSSALKGLSILENRDAGYRIYAIGYDQRLACWDVNVEELFNNPKNALLFVSSTPIDISDVSFLDCCSATTNDTGNTESKDIIITGGEGIELCSLDSSIYQAARCLQKCNYLLITCGAGFSAESGLSTYESMPIEYQDLCNPLKLVEDQQQFQRFWSNFAKTYSNTIPHKGYSILDQWCGEGRLHNLTKSTNAESTLSPWWIYSSNVDGLFNNFECFHETICEIHGRATHFRCANSIGYSNDVKRAGKLWDEWNDKAEGLVKTDEVRKKCDESIFPVQSCDEQILCSHCNLPARPNVLMFHDNDKNILQQINRSREQYQKWEAVVEEEILKGKHLVILELGAGLNVPAVRNESEEVLYDCLDRLKLSKDGTGSVCCIRVNPKDAHFSRSNVMVGNLQTSTVSIYENAEKALILIDRWMKTNHRT